MKQIIQRTLLICVFALNIAMLAENKGALFLQPSSYTFYADREYTFTITGTGLAGKTVEWNMKYAGRTLAAGKRTLSANGDTQIKVKFPKLNKGVIAEVEFSCFMEEGRVKGTKFIRAKGPEGEEGTRPEGVRAKGLEGEDGNRQKTVDTGSGEDRLEIKKQLYIFYPNPFAGQKEALKKLKIGVWEADGGEDLSALLKEYDLPFSIVDDPANFAGKVLLVSGLDFDENPGVSETLAKIAEKGSTVIILPPNSGTFANFAENAEDIRLSGNNVITEFNKKFDTITWNGDPISKSTITLVPYDGEVALEILGNRQKAIGNRDGFTFCEIRKGKGSLIFITWDIIKGANESPTPIYLLKELLLRAKVYEAQGARAKRGRRQ